MSDILPEQLTPQEQPLEPQQPPEGGAPGHIEVTYPEEAAQPQVETPTETADEPVHLASIDHDKDVSAGWDVDKAATVAGAIKAGGSFDRIIEDRDKKEASNDEHYDELIRIGLANESDLKARLASHEKRSVRTQEAIDREISPYEELYDLNPQAFAKMTTEEFMSIAKPLVNADKEVRTVESDLELLGKFRSQLESALENRQLVTWQFVDDFITEVGATLDMDDNAYLDLETKFKDVHAASFDKTPRQIMEGDRQLMDEYLAQVEDKKKATEQRRQAILDEHRPKESAE